MLTSLYCFVSVNISNDHSFIHAFTYAAIYPFTLSNFSTSFCANICPLCYPDGTNFVVLLLLLLLFTGVIIVIVVFVVLSLIKQLNALSERIKFLTCKIYRLRGKAELHTHTHTHFHTRIHAFILFRHLFSYFR